MYVSLKDLENMNVKVGPSLTDTMNMKIERGLGSYGFDKSSGTYEHKFIIRAVNSAHADVIEISLHHVAEAWLYLVKDTMVDENEET